jgi:hypothetical protein
VKRALPGILLAAAVVLAAVKLFPGIHMQQLTILSVPGGAAVSINGSAAGFTPLTRFVSADEVHLVLEKEGFFSRDTLLVQTSDTLFMQLSQAALLIIKTDPSGSTVRVGAAEAVSPCTVFAEPGVPLEILATGEMGITVTRRVNVLSSEPRLLYISVPYLWEDTAAAMETVVIPGELLPFATGPLTVGRHEVTARQFAMFMNHLDPSLETAEFTPRGRTVLMDRVLPANWYGPVVINEDTTGYAPLPGMEDHPVTGVSRAGALEFCSWLTEASSGGLVYRLPSPQEWSALAEPGEGMSANFSDSRETILNRHPDQNDGWGETAPSGAMGYSPWGLGNMQGNVWEWTGERGIAAGGSWLSSIEDCSAESFLALGDTLGYPFTGFRVVASGVPGNISRWEPSSWEEE